MRTAAIVVERVTPLTARLAVAFTELTLAAAVVVAAVIAGHELREWRAWYPTAYHPWLDAPLAAPEVVEP